MITITEATIAKLNVQRGDTLVLTYPGSLTPEMRARLRDATQAAFGNTPVVVLEDGLRLQVVSMEDEAGNATTERGDN